MALSVAFVALETRVRVESDMSASSGSSSSVVVISSHPGLKSPSEFDVDSGEDFENKTYLR